MSLPAIASWLDQLIGICKQIGVLGFLVFTGTTALASVLNLLPVPGPGSRWVPIRKVIVNLALARGYARMAVLPGSDAASVTNLDIIRKVEETHEESKAERAIVLSAVSNASVPITKDGV